jgi:deoxyribonuclease-4
VSGRPAGLRYGPSGLPPGSPAEAVAAVRAAGYDACEVSFASKYPPKGVLAPLGEAAREADVLLSVHAPLFAFPGNVDRQKRKVAGANMVHTAGFAKELGADVVVIHPGFLLGREREEAIGDVVAHLLEVGEQLEEKDRQVAFGVELMGRVRELGSLDDVLAIADAVPYVRPVIDFAHLQATSDGALRETGDFAAVLHAASSVLREDERLHVHFSDIRWANRNEDRHMPYGEGSLRAEPLRDALEALGRPVTVISESPDEDSHLAIGRALGVLET